jgi:hypothetical protein
MDEQRFSNIILSFWLGQKMSKYKGRRVYIINTIKQIIKGENTNA